MSIKLGSLGLSPRDIVRAYVGAGIVYESSEAPPIAAPRYSPVYKSSTYSVADFQGDKPAGTVAGDLLVGFFTDSAGGTIGIPAGWTAVGSQINNGVATVRVAYKIAGVSEPATYSFTSSPSDYPIAYIARYTNYDETDPVTLPVGSTGTSGTRTLASINSPYANGELLVLSQDGDAGLFSAAPSGMTLIQNVLDASNAGLFREALTASGATGTRSHTHSPSDFWSMVGVVINGAEEQAEASALFARMTVEPDTTRKGRINALIHSAKQAGVWAKLSVLYLFHAHDKQAAFLNWKSSSYTITETGSPLTFVANDYIMGRADGATNCLETGFGTDANHTTSAGSYGLGFKFVRDYQTQVTSFGTFDGSVMTDGSSTNMQARVHNSSYFVFSGFSAGHYAVSADGTDIRGYKDGVSAGAPVATSTPAQNGTYKLLRSNGYGTPVHSQLTDFFVGAPLSAGEIESLHSAIQAYKAA